MDLVLKSATPDFIPPTLWPPNSPDLNPVDYKIWSIMEEKVYRMKVQDVEDLHELHHSERIVMAWDELDQRIIDSAVGSGVRDFVHVSRLQADNLNTNCDFQKLVGSFVLDYIF